MKAGQIPQNPCGAFTTWKESLDISSGQTPSHASPHCQRASGAGGRRVGCDTAAVERVSAFMRGARACGENAGGVTARAPGSVLAAPNAVHPELALGAQGESNARRRQPSVYFTSQDGTGRDCPTYRSAPPSSSAEHVPGVPRRAQSGFKIAHAYNHRCPPVWNRMQGVCGHIISPQRVDALLFARRGLRRLTAWPSSSQSLLHGRTRTQVRTSRRRRRSFWRSSLRSWCVAALVTPCGLLISFP